MRRLLTAALFAALLLVLGCGKRDEPPTVQDKLKAMQKAHEYIHAHGSGLYLVEYSGHSMAHTMGTQGGILAYDPGHPYDQLAKGDVVIFWDTAAQSLVAHELVMQRGQSWITAGNNNSIVDGTWLTLDNYRGKVVRHFAFR